MLTKQTALLALIGLWLSAVASIGFAALPAGYQLDLKVLVIGPYDDPATANNVYVDAAKAILDRMGVPYELATYPNGSPPPANCGQLGGPPRGTAGCLPELEYPGTNHGRYQGVIFALSDWWMNAYYPAGWAGQIPDDVARLEAYLYKYNVRVASLYAASNQTGFLDLIRCPAASVSAPHRPIPCLLSPAESPCPI